ncbi:protein kinase [bacterium]|nr:protein kinase [bacterium]
MLDRLREIDLEIIASGAKLPRIDGLKVHSKIGRGSFGVVYKARQLDPDRVVDVKVIQIDTDRDKEAFGRFIKEAKLIARIKHENVVTFHYTGTAESRPYLVMEYASGGTLRKRLHTWREKWQARIAPDQVKWQRHVATLVRDVARGLAAAHEQGVIHRDLKPENILFDAKRRPMIADFGLARDHEELLSTRGAGEGTREYQAPEQIQREKVIDVRTDIFAVGIILFELLTGELPFKGDLVEALIADDTKFAPSPKTLNPATHRDLQAICEKCLQKMPDKRFASAVELADDLDRFLKGEPVLTRPISRWERGERFLNRHRLAVGLSLALIISIGIGGGVWYDQASKRAKAAELARVEEEKRKEEEAKRLAAEQAKATIEKESAAEIAAKQKTITEKEQEVKESDAKKALAQQENKYHDYADDMQRVQEEWKRGKKREVEKLLDRHDPARTSESFDLRGFEWYYWKHLLQAKGLTFHVPGPIRSIALGPSGKRIAVCDLSSVTVWDIPTNEKRWERAIFEMSRVRNGVLPSFSDQSVCFSPDGSKIAACGVVKEVGGPATFRVWNAADGAELMAVEEDADISGRAIVFSPNGDRIILAKPTTGWKSWSLRKGRCDLESFEESDATTEGNRRLIGGLNARLASQHFLGFSADGKNLLASCSVKEPSLAWRWPPDGMQRRAGSAQARPETLPDWVGDIPNGIIRLDPNLPMRVVRIQDGQILVLKRNRSGSVRRSIGLEHPNDLRIAEELLKGPDSALCVAQRAGAIAAGGSDGLVYVFRMDEGSGRVLDVETYRGHGAGVSAVGFLPNLRPVSGDTSGEIRLWVGDDPELIVLKASARGPEIVRIGTHHIAIKADPSDEQTPIPPSDNLFALRYYGARFSRNKKWAVLSFQGMGVGSKHRLFLWDIAEKRSIVEADYGPVLQSPDEMVFSGDESMFAAVTAKKFASVWSTKTGELIARIPVPAMASLELSASGRCLAVGARRNLSAEDTPIVIRSVPDGAVVSRLQMEHNPIGNSARFLFSPDEKSLIVDGNPPTVWDIQTGERLPRTLGDIKATALQSSGDGQRLYGRSGNEFAVFCPRTLRPLLQLRYRWEGGTKELPTTTGEVIPGSGGLRTNEVLDDAISDLMEQWKREIAP